MNYDIIEFPEEGDPKSSNQRVSKLEKWEGPNGHHFTTEGFDTA